MDQVVLLLCFIQDDNSAPVCGQSGFNTFRSESRQPVAMLNHNRFHVWIGQQFDQRRPMPIEPRPNLPRFARYGPALALGVRPQPLRLPVHVLFLSMARDARVKRDPAFGNVFPRSLCVCVCAIKRPGSFQVDDDPAARHLIGWHRQRALLPGPIGRQIADSLAFCPNRKFHGFNCCRLMFFDNTSFNCCQPSFDGAGAFSLPLAALTAPWIS